jgi:hypothetical protein
MTISPFVLKPAHGVPDIHQLQVFTGLHFPHGTSLVNGYYEGFQYHTYMAVLEFDARDTDAFLREIYGKRAGHAAVETSTTNRELGGATYYTVTNHTYWHAAWWHPGWQHRYRTVSIEYDDVQVGMLIGYDDPHRQRVYLYAKGDIWATPPDLSTRGHAGI